MAEGAPRMKGRALRRPAGPDPVPAGIMELFRGVLARKLFPLERYPRQWFPEMDTVLGDLFRAAWTGDPGFSQALAGDDADHAGERIEAKLGLAALLADHPHSLVLIYRHMIFGLVRRLHRRRDEWQDILQEILTRLMAGKLARIGRNYDAGYGPKPSFTSYFMVCVRNMYIDIMREEGALMKRTAGSRDLELATDIAGPTTAGQQAFLDDEFARLRLILQLQPSSRARIRLLLKLKCRCAVSPADVRACFPGCSVEDGERLRGDFRRMNDQEMYRAVAPAFQRNEAQPVQADTLRKWTEGRTALLIDHLNRLHGGPVYDPESIRDLLDLYFAQEGTDEQG